MTKFSMRYSNGVDTIPENEPQYDVIDNKYQNFAVDASSVEPKKEQRQRHSLGMGSSQTPPLRQNFQDNQMVVLNRAQSHNVIPVSPGSEEKKPVFTSSSSGNVSARPVSRSSSNGQSSHPWYCSSNPGLLAHSPSHMQVPANGITTLPENSIITCSQASTLPAASHDPASEHTYSTLTPPTPGSVSLSQSIPREYPSSSHRPLEKSVSNNIGSGNTRVSSRQSNASSSSGGMGGSRQSSNYNRSMNDKSLPTSDV